MDIETVHIGTLMIGDRHREYDEEKAKRLAESMKVLGLLQPITVYVDGNDIAYLLAGLHRYRAAEMLNWDTIDAIVVDLSPTRIEMVEIAENLFRHDLTKEQRDAHIRRYADLLKQVSVEEEEAENPSRQNDPVEIGYKKPPPRPKGIARKIAEETGLSKSTINRALKPAPPVPKRIKTEKDIFLMRAEQAHGFANACGKLASETDAATLSQLASVARATAEAWSTLAQNLARKQ